MESRIRNARHMFPIDQNVPLEHLMDHVLLDHMPRDMVTQSLERGFPAEPGKRPARHKSAKARVEHGKWMVDCVTENCYAAYYVTPEDPRYFCVYCNNAEVEGRWCRVIFPGDQDREAIEELLSRRIDPLTQNWFPWESLDDLLKENEDEGHYQMVIR